MSKFFIETSPYHDNGEIFPQLFSDVQLAIDYAKSHVKDEGFNIWEIGETELIEVDSYLRPDHTDKFMGTSEYKDWDLHRSMEWNKKRGNIQSWNDHVIKNGFGEEYLIK